jgi:hypothetical protein
MLRTRSINALVALFLLGTACAEPEDTIELENREIVDNLVLAGFPEDKIEIRNDMVFVDTDAHVTLEASREMADLRFRQYATTNRVGEMVADICIDGRNATGKRVSALAAAIDNYNSQGLSFVMREIGADATGCNAVIALFEDNSVGGHAGFPAGGLPYDSITIGTGLEPYSLGVNTHVITHELGHCVAFRHSDWYDRRISCGGRGPAKRFNEGEAGVGAEHIPHTPTDAVFDGSVMNACFHSGCTGEWTDTDETALWSMYGIDAPPHELVCDDQFDDDGDTLVDCDDADCADDAACGAPPDPDPEPDPTCKADGESCKKQPCCPGLACYVGGGRKGPTCGPA